MCFPTAIFIYIVQNDERDTKVFNMEPNGIYFLLNKYKNFRKNMKFHPLLLRVKLGKKREL